MASEQRRSWPSTVVERNRRIHDACPDDYAARHPEIFNPTEQARIRAVLQDALASVDCGSRRPAALDYGAGTGNLTRHLLNLGCLVTAVDVSSQSLATLQRDMSGHADCRTVVVDGVDLADLASASFDIVTTYSVLHHVPDYLGIIDEFLRVVKPGGVIIIDHEVCDSYWSCDENYFCYLEELGGRFRDDHAYELGLSVPGPAKGRGRWRRLFSPAAWAMLAKELVVPRDRTAGLDGDIHVFVDDHIEWEAIKCRLQDRCCIVRDEDYLVCREPGEEPFVWQRWFGRTADMHLLVAKRSPV